MMKSLICNINVLLAELFALQACAVSASCPVETTSVFTELSFQQVLELRGLVEVIL